MKIVRLFDIHWDTDGEPIPTNWACPRNISPSSMTIGIPWTMQPICSPINTAFASRGVRSRC